MNKKRISLKVCGVYKLEDVATGVVYVGSAVDIGKRWSNHLADLRNNRYRYHELQEAFNADVNRIKFEVLEVCSKDERTEREKWYFDYVKKVDGWTLINRSDKAHTHKVEDTSNMKKAQIGEGNGNARLTEQQVREILWLKENKYNQYKIADVYNISQTHVYAIGVTKWLHIKETSKPSEKILDKLN